MNYDPKRFIIDFCVLFAAIAIIGISGYAAGATDEKDKIHAYCVEKGLATVACNIIKCVLILANGKTISQNW